MLKVTKYAVYVGNIEEPNVSELEKVFDYLYKAKDYIANNNAFEAVDGRFYNSCEFYKIVKFKDYCRR